MDQMRAIDAQDLIDVDELFGNRRVDHGPWDLAERDAVQV
jgi:hypothetical protein